MEIQPVLQTAGLYMSNQFQMNFKVLLRKQEIRDYFASPFAMSPVAQKLQRLMLSSANNTIYFLEGDFAIACCAVFVGEWALILGPMRIEQISKKSMCTPLNLSDEARENYYHRYTKIPLVEKQKLLVGVQLIFISLYDNVLEAKEVFVNCHKYNQNMIEALEYKEIDYDNQDLANDRTVPSLSMFSAISIGNHVAALRLYDKVMSTKKITTTNFDIYNNPKGYICAMEGLTTIRAHVSFALSAAGVPANKAYPLLRKYKVDGRKIHGVAEADKLSQTLIVEACRLIRKQKGEKYSKPIQEAIDFIHSNLSQNIAVADIASIVHMTPTSLTRKFHSELGVTTVAYINHERMKQAAELLLYTRFEIRDICALVGIPDANYFSKCFKKEYGCSPTNYRKANENNR